jgi:KaiC/GvpD/RAD55 family RecA-like ATPase
MDYRLTIDGSEGIPETVPGGTAILLLHPSIAETDRIDTDFLRDDTDAFLVISTRTTAREVKQKLEYYDVDESKADILDTLSVERGYSRRSAEGVHYVSSPEDTEGIVETAETFLADHDGRLRISVDSITEFVYYADEERARDLVEKLVELLDAHDAVGLFHLSNKVHDDDTVAAFTELFDGVIELAEDGSVRGQF